jgi:putative ABC transport system permease protein
VSQLALSFTLLTGAGLLVRSLINLTSVDLGFRTEQVLAVETPTGPSGEGLPMVLPGEEADWTRTMEEIRAFPGVRSVAVAAWTPLSDHATQNAYTVRIDESADADERSHLATSNNVSPGYFETLGIPLIEGRTFDWTDQASSPDVIVLNESMARAHFGDDEAIGRRISLGSDAQPWFRSNQWYEVVGVVADSRDSGMDSEGAHTFYRPATKAGWGPTILVAHAGDTGALTQHIRDVVRRIHPDRAVEEAQTMASLLDQEMAPSRLNAILFGSFAALALLIAAVGVLATLAFSVSQRVKEFGIRMALGADRRSVLANVMGEGILMVAVGLVVGGGAALVLGRFLSGLLFGVDPTDTASMAAAALLLGAVALVSTLFPALRATRIHPSEALKGE